MKNLFITKIENKRLHWLKYMPSWIMKDLRISRKDFLQNLEFVNSGDIMRLKDWDVIMSCHKEEITDKTWKANALIFKDDMMHTLKRTKLVGVYVNDVSTDENKILFKQSIKAEISDVILVAKALAIWTDEQKAQWWKLILDNECIEGSSDSDLAEDPFSAPSTSLSDATITDIKAQIDNLVDATSGTV